MTDGRRSFRQRGWVGSRWGGAGASPEGREGVPPHPAGQIAFLASQDAEDPDGRWFLPLARALKDLGRPEEGAVILRRGLARDPDCLAGWVVLAQCYAALGERGVARSLFESVIGRDPENALALRGLAEIHARAGDRRLAADRYRALLRLMPRDLAAQEALASLLEGFEPERVEPEGALARPQSGDAGAPLREDSLAAAERLPAAAELLPPATDPPPPAGEARRLRPAAGARRATPVPPRHGRAALPPEGRPRPGIFEPPPADLDWGTGGGRAARLGPPARRDRTPAPPATAPALAPPDPAGRAPQSLEGYRRWIERMAEGKAGENGAGTRAGDVRLESPPARPDGGD